MSLLSKQAETKLIGAIESAATLVNSGMSPNEAIIKSATDNAVPPGHIDLMVHAYNTGRTTKQREQSDSTLEKAADFPLASIDEIKATMFGANVKTSAEIKAQHVVSPEYALNPTAMIKRAVNSRQSAPAPFVPTFERPPRDEHEQARREYSQKRAAHWQIEEERRQVTETYNKTAAKMDELITYFKTPGHVSYPDALKDVQLTHGEQGALVMQKLAHLVPATQKEAGRNVRIITDVTARKLVGDILDLVDNYNELSSAYAAKTAAAQTRVEKKVEPEICTGSILFKPEEVPLTLKEAKGGWPQPPIYPAPAANPQKPPSKSQSDEPLPDYVENYFTAPIKTVGGIMGIGAEKEKSHAMPGQSQYNQISDAEQDAAIKNIKAKSVLHDLILNDPIISAHDPQDVAMAFNDVAELAPNLADTPGMLQTVLRKRLEAGQLADFDVKQILEMDKLRAERDKIQGEARRINMETM